MHRSTRRLSSLGLGLVLLSLAAPAAAEVDVPPSEDPPAPAPAPPSTTVVAPPGSGVTVVAPTPGGGKVTASGCTAVQVEGGTTIVKPADASVADVACAPYAPPDTAPKIVFVESPNRPAFAPDPSRTGLIVLGALGTSLGGAITGLWYLSAHHDERWRMHDGTPSWIPWTAYTLTMALSPIAASLHVGATARGLGFGAAIASSIVVSKAFDVDRDASAVIFGFVVPTTLAVVALATTPHAEDLAPRKKGVLEQIAVAPVADKTHGLTGATVGVGGLF